MPAVWDCRVTVTIRRDEGFMQSRSIDIHVLDYPESRQDFDGNSSRNFLRNASRSFSCFM